MSPALDRPARTKEQAPCDLAQRAHEDPQWRFRWERNRNSLKEGETP